MKRFAKKTRFALCLSVLTALLLAGCPASDDSADNTSASATPAPAPATQSEESVTPEPTPEPDPVVAPATQAPLVVARQGPNGQTFFLRQVTINSNDRYLEFLSDRRNMAQLQVAIAQVEQQLADPSVNVATQADLQARLNQLIETQVNSNAVWVQKYGFALNREHFVQVERSTLRRAPQAP